MVLQLHMFSENNKCIYVLLSVLVLYTEIYVVASYESRARILLYVCISNMHSDVLSYVFLSFFFLSFKLFCELFFSLIFFSSSSFLLVFFNLISSFIEIFDRNISQNSIYLLRNQWHPQHFFQASSLIQLIGHKMPI